MEELINIFQTYGLAIGLIALAGVAVLGILKYCKVFDKVATDTTRHLIYIICSAGLTLIGIAIYLLCTHAWNWTFYFMLAPIVWALNQTFYNIFKATKLNDLIVKILDGIKNLIASKKAIQEIVQPEQKESSEDSK